MPKRKASNPKSNIKRSPSKSRKHADKSDIRKMNPQRIETPMKNRRKRIRPTEEYYKNKKDNKKDRKNEFRSPAQRDKDIPNKKKNKSKSLGVGSKGKKKLQKSNQNKEEHEQPKSVVVPYQESIQNTVYQFQVKNLKGNWVSMEKYRGFPLIIVNTASKDLALAKKNFEQLKLLHATYHHNGLRIAAFPSDDFRCEPLDDKEIEEEYLKKLEITFDVYAKIQVNGDNADPLFVWLKNCKMQLKGKSPSASENLIKFNFAKFLMDRHGLLFRTYPPFKEPLLLENDIKSLLV